MDAETQAAREQAAHDADRAAGYGVAGSEAAARTLAELEAEELEGIAALEIGSGAVSLAWRAQAELRRRTELERIAEKVHAAELEAVDVAASGQTSLVVADEDRPLPGLAPEPDTGQDAPPSSTMTTSDQRAADADRAYFAALELEGYL